MLILNEKELKGDDIWEKIEYQAIGIDAAHVNTGAGNREIYGTRQVLVETTNPGGIGERGKCLNRESGCANYLQQHCSRCPKWEKWRVLK